MQLYFENTIVQTISYLFYGVFAWYVFMSVKSDFGSEKEIQYFKAQILSYLVYLFSTWAWTLNELRAFNIEKNLLMLLAIVCHISVSCTMYLWIKYYVYHLQLYFSEKRWFKRIFSVPIAMALILIFSAVKHDFVFYTRDVGGRTEIVYGKYYNLLYAFFGIYFIFVVTGTIYSAIRLKEKERRQEIILFVGYIFILSPVVMFSHFLKVLSVTTVSHLAAIFFTYISIQETRVRMDGLTKLNNRRVAEEYLIKAISELVVDKEEVAVFMMDINDFKMVNDKYGHLEGDKALVTVGNAIKKVAASNSCFVGRYGGDEFIMIFRNKLYKKNNIAKTDNRVENKTQNKTENKTDTQIKTNKSISFEDFEKMFENNIYNTLSRKLNSAIEHECKLLNLEYELTLSVGYCVCRSPIDDPKSIIKLADEHLYEEKEKYHNAKKTNGKR